MILVGVGGAGIRILDAVGARGCPGARSLALDTDVSGAGDVNADGYLDLLVGASLQDEHEGNAGAAYLFLGPVTADLDATLAHASLTGVDADDQAGNSVSGAGDVDADGYDDLLVGARFAGTEYQAGQVYLVRGPVSGEGTLGSSAAWFEGAAFGDNAGWAVAGVGDVDGDGLADVLFGAPYADLGGDNAGAAYLFVDPISSSGDLSLAHATFVGEEAADWAGYSMAGAGDVNADGQADFLIGAPYANGGGNNSGATYLFTGPVSGEVDLAAASTRLVGDDDSILSGYAVAGAGDVNADGYDDFLTSAYDDDEGDGNAGAVYLVLGPAAASGDLSLAAAKLLGEDRDDRVGESVAGPGDVNGDGFDDLLMGTSDDDDVGSGSGAAYLVLGPVSGDLDLSCADHKYLGLAAGDGAGVSVAGPGDVTGSGQPDLLVGAYKWDGSRGDEGAVFVVPF